MRSSHRSKWARSSYIPGNHDLCLWDWYARSRGLFTLPPTTGLPLTPIGTTGPGTSFSPSSTESLDISYPIYHDVSVGADFPVLIFTHGHLLDPLVRGEDPDYEYEALAALGCQPTKCLGETSVEGLARSVHDFVLSLWRRYSPRDRHIRQLRHAEALAPPILPVAARVE